MISKDKDAFKDSHTPSDDACRVTLIDIVPAPLTVISPVELFIDAIFPLLIEYDKTPVPVFVIVMASDNKNGTSVVSLFKVYEDSDNVGVALFIVSVFDTGVAAVYT